MNVGFALRVILLMMGGVMLLFFAVDRLVPRARYIRSNPQPNTALPVPPATITIDFSNELAPESEISVASTVTVLPSGEQSFADGRRFTAKGPDEHSSQRTSLQIDLPVGLPRGLYWVNWRAVAARGHAESFGRFCFAAGMPVPVGLTDEALYERSYREREYRATLLGGVLLVALGLFLPQLKQ